MQGRCVIRSVWDSESSPTAARERFLGGSGPAGAAGVRVPILASWERCQSHGLGPGAADLPYRDGFESEEPLLAASGPVLERLHRDLLDTKVSVLLTDASARVLARRAGEPGLNRALDGIQLAEGFVYSEAYAGTNGIGTALAEGRPTVVYAGEHFRDQFTAFACAGVPIRDPLDGRIRGILDLSTWHQDANALMAVLAAEAAGAIERRLLRQYSRRERMLTAAFTPDIGGGEFDDPSLADTVTIEMPAQFSGADRTRVRNKAAEMVAAARRDTVVIPLSQGRRTTLLAKPETGPEGTEVVTVAASMPVPQFGATAENASTEVVLVAEPTVGRLAVEARQRLGMLLEASGRIGTTLDLLSTAGELADIAMPDFAQHVTVDLADWVIAYEENAPDSARLKFQRSAVRTTRMGDRVRPVGTRVGYTGASAQARCLLEKGPVLDPELTAEAVGPHWTGEGPRSSVIAAPIIVHGTVLGVASFYRFGEDDVFAEDDVNLAGDLASRAAVALDNARRYQRERHLALALQRSLLPRAPATQYAVEVAQTYKPAQEEVGGDWYDVIPLSGGRVALVVGDVVGHGIHAAATMGRLRTAVRNFSALDLPPEDLLGQLDALVDSMDQDEAEDGRGIGIIGATCLYVIYDPVTGLCCLAAAGHPSPAVVAPDGTVAFIDVPTGPPLGLGGMSFEPLELTLAEGSTLVLYTDGLVESREQDIVVGMDRLAAVLAQAGRSPKELCDAAVRHLLPAKAWDDVAMLAARTRRTDAGRVATWDVPLSPEAVAGLRARVTRQLLAWGLDEMVFTTELVVSELVTNAIRHATGPVELRLLRDRALICEVADGSSVSPRLRRAQSMDEGGRGLFLVARLTQRWGTRFTARGKVIWAEQALPLAMSGPAAPVPEPRAVEEDSAESAGIWQ